jgi:hypothetical protein
MEQQGLATSDHARAEDGMRQIGGGFVDTLDRVKLGGRAESKACKLGKDEPHPVPLLPAGAEFAQGGGVSVFLGVEKAAKVRGISVNE